MCVCVIDVCQSVIVAADEGQTQSNPLQFDSQIFRSESSVVNSIQFYSVV